MSLTTRLCLLALALAAAAGGCTPSGNLYSRATFYTLEHPPPRPDGRQPLPVVLRVDPFETAPPYDSERLAYREAPHTAGQYFYHRWRARPGDLVAYHLRRDLAASGLFRAVTSPQSTTLADFYLEGVVEEFLEAEGDSAPTAVLAVTVVLARRQAGEHPHAVLQQRGYRVSKPCGTAGPEALAAAMDEAVAELARHVLDDVYALLAAEAGGGSN